MTDKLTPIGYKIVIVCILAFISTIKISAQENNIFELNVGKDLYKTIKTKSIDSKKNNSREEFYKLSQNLHTTAYISENAISKTNGRGDIKKLDFGDSKSFKLLSQSNYNNVELITIILKNTSDLNNKIDLTKDYKLGKLKYVFIKCYFKCNANQIKQFITTDSNIRVFYTAQTPS